MRKLFSRQGWDGLFLHQHAPSRRHGKTYRSSNIYTSEKSKLLIFKACFVGKSHIASCSWNFWKEFVCKKAPVLQKGSLAFLFLCCRRKNKFTAENFLFYTTGCDLRVSCACFPVELQALLCACAIAAGAAHSFSGPCSLCGKIESVWPHGNWYGNLTEFVRKIYGKPTEWKFFTFLGFTAKVRKEYGKATEKIRNLYGSRQDWKKLAQYVRRAVYNIYFLFCI